MTIDEYQSAAARTIDTAKKPEDWSSHALYGMASEVGEVMGIYQKTYQGHRLTASKLREELGDLIWFIAEYCTAHRWRMDEIMGENIEKLKKRYPDGFSAERSVNREEYKNGTD